MGPGTCQSGARYFSNKKAASSSMKPERSDGSWPLSMGVALKLTHCSCSLGGLLSRGQFPQVTILADLDDLDAKVRREKRPSSSPSLALLEAANGENGLFAVSPAHAGAFQPLGGGRLARRFDQATANGKPPRLIIGVVQAIPLVLEVRQLGVEQCAPPLVKLATHLTHQPGHRGDHVVSTAGLVAEQDTQAFVLGASLDTLLAVIRHHGSPEMLARMPVVDDLRGVLVDRLVEVAPVFLGPIGQRDHLQVWPYGKKSSQLGIQLCRQRLLLGLWRSPVAHRVESLGVLVKERHGATAHFPVACGATELLGQSLLLGGLTGGLGGALGILV